MANVPYGHEPASLFSGSEGVEGSGAPPSIFSLPKRTKRHPLVEWSNRTAHTLRQEAGPRLKEIERNVKYYNGDQWNKNRAPWKNRVVVNMALWVCDQWSALLCDNKPRFVYESLRVEDEPQAEIATAMRQYDEYRDSWDQKREQAVLTSRIKKEAYYALRYDPSAHGGEGGITLKVVDPENVFMNKGAKSLEDADCVLHEYYDTPGALLSRYKRLRGAIRSQSGYPESSDKAQDVLVPAQTVESTAGQLYSGSRSAPLADRPGGQGSSGSAGVLVRDWWLRPKGPKNEIKIKRMRWNADNRLATRKKFIRFPDQSIEPLQRVITEGSIVYELPMSIASLLHFASELPEGLKVLDVRDAVSPMYEERKVPKYPAGRKIVIVGDHVADDGGNPFAHREIGLVHLPARVDGGTKKPLGDIDLIWEMCETLNRIAALIMDNAILTSNPVWIVPIDEQMSDEDLTNAPGAIIRATPIASKLLRREQGANLPSYVMAYVNWIKEQIREISGLSEAATGGKFKGQQSAETVSMYQESASVRFRQAIRLIEQAEVKLGRQYLSLCAQFYAEPLLVKVKDALGIDRHIEFLGSDLTRNMTMKAKAGSGLPSSPSARLNTVMALYGQGLIDILEVLKVLQENGSIESANALLKRIESYIKDPNQAWKMPVLFAQLTGGAKKGKSNKGNSGRSARSTTPNKALASSRS